MVRGKAGGRRADTNQAGSIVHEASISTLHILRIASNLYSVLFYRYCHCVPQLSPCLATIPVWIPFPLPRSFMILQAPPSFYTLKLTAFNYSSPGQSTSAAAAAFRPAPNNSYSSGPGSGTILPSAPNSCGAFKHAIIPSPPRSRPASTKTICAAPKLLSPYIVPKTRQSASSGSSSAVCPPAGGSRRPVSR